MDPNGLSEAVTRLLLIFPNADPLFLNSAILHNLPSASSIPPTTTPGTVAKGKRKDTKTVEHVVQAVANKLVFLNHGEYPRVVWRRDAARRNELKGKGTARVNEMVDTAMVRNLALIRLHGMFPLTPIADLKRTILTHHHSPLFLSTETLLSAPPPSTATKTKTKTFASWFTWTRSPPTLEQLSLPCLRPQDLFRSEAYLEALSTRLGLQFPGVPKNVRARLVREAGGWVEARLAVSGWNSKPVTRLFNWFSPSASSSSTAEPSLPPPKDEELEEEIWISLLSERKAQEAEDEKLARELNASWVDEDQKFSCGCCFDDVPFEEIVVCSSTVSTEPHFFCQECIRRQVKEHVYDGAPFMPYSEGSGGTGIRCLSIEGCQASFSSQTLARVLPPVLLKALERRLADRAVDAIVSNALTTGGTVIQCPFCPYKELEDGWIWERAFPLFRSSLSRTRSRVNGDSTEWIENLEKVWRSSRSLLLLAPIYIAAIFIVASSPVEFSEFFDPHQPGTSPATKVAPTPQSLYPLLEPIRTISIVHRYLTSVAKLTISTRMGQRSVFQCRNGPSHSPRPSFGALAPFATSHSELVAKVWGSNEASSASVAGEEGSCGKLSCLVCFKEWKEGVHTCIDQGLRLAVEKAMSEAVKRDCPNCGVGFVKSGGCNKMTCRCGYIQCYCCRQQVTNGYAHFCQHFRDECTKCLLFGNEDEKKAIAEAAEEARKAWMNAHSGMNVSVVLLHENRDRLTRVCRPVLDYILE